MPMIRSLALTLRFLLELAAVTAVGWWGFTLDAPIAVRIIAGVAAPVVVIVVWGAVVAPRAPLVVPGWLRQTAEALVWLAAVLALVAGGAPGLAAVLAVLIVLDRVALALTTGTVSRLERVPE